MELSKKNSSPKKIYKFKEIHCSEIAGTVPNFYHPENRYFNIVKNKEVLGVIGIRPFNKGCNFGVHMYQRFRMTRQLINEAFMFPMTLNYTRVFFNSSNPIVTTFLDYMGKHGIHYFCTMFEKRYYWKDILQDYLKGYEP